MLPGDVKMFLIHRFTVWLSKNMNCRCVALEFVLIGRNPKEGNRFFTGNRLPEVGWTVLLKVV